MKIVKLFNEAANLHDRLTVKTFQRIIVSLFLLISGYTTASNSKTKNVAQLPSFKDTPSNYTYAEGDLAVLYCSIQNLGARSVIWRKGTYPHPLTIGMMTYSPDERYQIHHIPEKGEWNLFIKNIQHNDSGIYECQVSTKEKYIRKLIRVIVIDRPYADRSIEINGPQSVNKGDVLVLSCNATGGKYVPNDLDWWRDGQKLISDKSGRINITKHISYVTNTVISNLVIKHVVARDEGLYECRTTDEMLKQTNVEVVGEGSENVKRTISQDAQATSCATSSTFVLYIVVFCLHCSFRLENMLKTLTS